MIDVRALLDSPSWPSDRGLDAILRSLLQQRDALVDTDRVDPASLWRADSFALDRVDSFTHAPAGRQEEILRRCASERLAEALFIEKLGLVFCAKMTLLAATSEERMLYSLIAADEATHFHWIAQFAADADPHSPFLSLLAEIVARGAQGSLTMLVQVVLEGWGVHHYRMLARDCANPKLRRILGHIAADEARHHASGERLMAHRALDDTERADIASMLRRLLDMVRCGPQSVIAAIGPSDLEEATWCFAQIGSDDTLAKLELLRKLIGDAPVGELSVELERAGAFTPMSAEECANCLMS